MAEDAVEKKTDDWNGKRICSVGKWGAEIEWKKKEAWHQKYS